MKASKSLFILFATLATLCCRAQSTEELYQRFMEPDRDCRPRVWWHWMNGNITKDGIRKDLEWMDRAGIVGFHNFDANFDTPQVVEKRLVYMTPEWKDAFNYALDVADSLDMEVSVASSPGWSITGGPWVGMEDAEKKLVWRDTTVRGGQLLSVPLPEPFQTCGPYQDILLYPGDPDRYNWYEDLCVLAVRLPGDAWPAPAPRFVASDPSFDVKLLSDKSFRTGTELAPDGDGYAWLELDYDAPTALRSLYFVEFTGVPVCLEADLAGDGRWTAIVDEVPMSRRKSITVRSFDFPETEALRFRLRSLVKGRSLKPGELSMSRETRVNLAEDKAGFLPTFTVADRYPTPPSGPAPTLRDVVDLSAKVRDGALEWQAPEGCWRIFRFGVNLLGNRNGPASPEATGLEVDKLDGAAVRRYYDEYLGMYQDASGGRLGEAIHCLMIDSYESGKCTWTPAMEREFRSRRGYALRPWLPVLTGMVLESSERSEQFLFDWRSTLGELIAENHYDIVSDILDQYGMKRYTESHEWREAFTGDGMMPKRKADFPMAAMWIHIVDEGRHSSYPAGDADIRESSSIAHIFGQNIAAGESFTVDGRIGERREMGAYQSAPCNLKPLADAEMAEGLNRFVIHTSVHQPVDDKAPGLALGPFGQWFTRHETWAEEARCWTDYLSRSCYLLQQGRWAADVAYFYGEDKNVTGTFIDRRIGVPEGYNFDLVNADILLNVLKCRGGRLVSPTGIRYRVLQIDEEVKYMSLPVLRRIGRIAASGVRVCGPKPVAKAGLKGSGRRFRKLADRIWARPNVTEGFDAGVEKDVDWGMLQEYSDLGPDGELRSLSADVRFIHRSLPEGELYWIANITPVARNMTVSFRVSGLVPEVWHPDTGLREKPFYRVEGGRTVVGLHFIDDDAQFILFSKEDETGPSESTGVVEQTLLTLGKPWTVRFQEGRGAPSEAVFRDLISYTESPVEGIRHFSGEAWYSTTFTYDPEPAASSNGSTVWLDLGTVHHMARVFLNGQDLGIAWRTPYRFNVGDAIREGVNTLEIKVINSWANRVIADVSLPPEKRISFTPMQYYEPGEPLVPSGLLGPVRLLATAPSSTVCDFVAPS